MDMKWNVGGIDKALRVTIGVVLILLASYQVIGIWGYIVGLLPIMSAVANNCPLYSLLGISTRKGKKKTS